jgi:hypothetical protein
MKIKLVVAAVALALAAAAMTSAPLLAKSAQCRQAEARLDDWWTAQSMKVNHTSPRDNAQ